MTALRARRIATGIVVGLIVAVLCLVFALDQVELWRLRVEFQDAEFTWAVPLIMGVFLFYRLKATRWSQLLAPTTRVSGSELFPAVIIGYAGNTLVPLQFGDLLRAGIAARQQHLPIAPVLVSIGLERVIDLLTLLVPVGIALAVLPNVPAETRNIVLLFSALAVVALAVFLVYVFGTKHFMAVTRWLCSRLPPRVSAVILKQADLGVEGLATLRSIYALSKVLLSSTLHWAVWIFAVWCSLRAINIAVPVVAALFATVLMVIGTNLPNSPGFVGSIQLAYVLALKPFGVPAEEALAASFFFHLLAYPGIVLAGLVYVWKLRIGWQDLRAIFPGRPGSGAH